ncbi:MAG: 2-oxo acid dehydrogenase subunit E2 [Sediminibacterium sp.]|nr:2-oxo acid dehydrogenase subunit E2 [Sediminibacterium sp.]
MAIAELVMPKLGESIMEATILKWHKQVGDSVKLDETVLDIATDKVDSEVPSTAEGTITEILFNVNDVVPIGTVIARINTVAASHAERSESPVVAPTVQTPPPPVVPAPPPVAVTPTIASPQPVTRNPEPEASHTEHSEVPYTPHPNPVELLSKPATNRFYSPLVLNIANSEGISLSELERIPGTGNDGRVSKKDILQYIVDKKAGRVPAFQPIAPQAPVYVAPPVQIPVQPQPVPAQPVYTAPTPQPPAPVVTDTPVQTNPEIAAPKAVPSVQPSQPEIIPTPTTLVSQPVSTPALPVEQPVIHSNPEPLAKPAAIVDKQEPVTPVQPLQPIQEPVIAPVHTPVPETRRQLEPVEVPQPVIKTEPVRTEIPNHIPSNYVGKLPDPRSVVVSGETEIMEMDRMRKLIAKHMVDSKHTSPHVTSFAEADVTNMVAWREKVKKEFEFREGTKLTFTPMFIECLVTVMRRFPLINCSIDGDKVVIKKDINIGMATALPSGNLIVPVIKGADQLSIVGLSKAVNGLADAARNSKLKPEDTTGGTFTLTNVGTFGSLMGTPIINQPQVAILAVGAIKKRPVVIESAEGDTIGIRHMMYLSLSYDHRIVDGSIGASFLTEVAKEFEKWDADRQWFHYL